MSFLIKKSRNNLMKKYIIITALIISSTLSAMDNHITTIITLPKSDILYRIFRDNGFLSTEATELSKHIENKTFKECDMYLYIKKAVMDKRVQIEHKPKNLSVEINNVMTNIKKQSIIHTTSDNPVTDIPNESKAKL